MNGNQLTYDAGFQDQDIFLRDILSARLRLSRSLVTRLKQQSRIRVNGSVALTNRRIHAGDRITVDLDFAERNELIPEPIPLTIIYQDEDFLVVDKPAGLATHPARRGGTGTLANAVTYYWQEQGRDFRFRPINRLDKDTSGLVLIGKSQFAHQGIFGRGHCRLLERSYTALVEGRLEQDAGRIDRPIARLDDYSRRRLVSPDGQPAVTLYQVLARYPEHTLLALQLETGRTHQIRVHLSSLGHPLCGDLLYGQPSPLIGRQALHAGRLRFVQPRSGEIVSLETHLPQDMRRAIAGLERIG